MANKICSINGCNKLARIRGLCLGHYHRLNRYGDPTYQPCKHKKIKKCKVDGCERDSIALGLCSMHYQRKRRNETRKTDKAIYGIYMKHPYEAKSYLAMKERCLNPSHPSYARYGGANIKICDRWLGDYGFYNFLQDMKERPKNKTIDRIDNNGDYCLENCRWASVREQNRNRKTNIFYTYKGETLVLADWAKKYNLNPSMVYSRYHRNERGAKLFRPSQKQ